jgi:hypothetical protein
LEKKKGIYLGLVVPLEWKCRMDKIWSALKVGMKVGIIYGIHNPRIKFYPNLAADKNQMRNEGS